VFSLAQSRVLTAFFSFFLFSSFCFFFFFSDAGKAGAAGGAQQQQAKAGADTISRSSSMMSADVRCGSCTAPLLWGMGTEYGGKKKKK
jgi:hypothetical protein